MLIGWRVRTTLPILGLRYAFSGWQFVSCGCASIFIGGVVLLVVLILGVFSVTMIGLLVDITEGWGSSLFNEFGVAHFHSRAHL